MISNESGDKLKVASLQSDLGLQVVNRYEQKGIQVPDSILFYTEGEIYERSAAVLRICAYLKWPYSWLRIFRVIPQGVRDYLYAIIAKNRYRWFGMKESCRVPTAEERAKFLG